MLRTMRHLERELKNKSESCLELVIHAYTSLNALLQRIHDNPDLFETTTKFAYDHIESLLYEILVLVEKFVKPSLYTTIRRFAFRRTLDASFAALHTRIEQCASDLELVQNIQIYVKKEESSKKTSLTKSRSSLDMSGTVSSRTSVSSNSKQPFIKAALLASLDSVDSLENLIANVNEEQEKEKEKENEEEEEQLCLENVPEDNSDVTVS